MPEAILSLAQRRQRFSKSMLPHSSVRITQNRAPVSITSVTNGMSERERTSSKPVTEPLSLPR